MRNLRNGMSFSFSSTMRKSHNIMEVRLHCIDIFIGVGEEKIRVTIWVNHNNRAPTYPLHPSPYYPFILNKLRSKSFPISFKQ